MLVGRVRWPAMTVGKTGAANRRADIGRRASAADLPPDKGDHAGEHQVEGPDGDRAEGRDP